MNEARIQSISSRLAALAKERNEDFQQVLTRYGLERFMYRLSQSPMRELFCLKGALLFALWFDAPHRPTRDADFLGSGEPDERALRESLASICAIPADDGMAFDPREIRVVEIREDARYAGLRATLVGLLGRSRCPVQIDIGFGDAVTPGPQDAVYPTLLADLPAPKLRVYPRASVMAEKLDAIVVLGMTNSRLKDYFDLLALVRENGVDEELLTRALVATFERRATQLPDGIPIGLSEQFGLDAVKQKQWAAFLRRNRLEAPPLPIAVAELSASLSRPVDSAMERVQSGRRDDGRGPRAGRVAEKRAAPSTRRPRKLGG